MKVLIKIMAFITLSFTLTSLHAGEYCQKNTHIHEQFRILDKNNDGQINKLEVTSQPDIVKDMNLYANDSFDLGDINEDGALDFKEFQANEEMLSAE